MSAAFQTVELSLVIMHTKRMTLKAYALPQRCKEPFVRIVEIRIKNVRHIYVITAPRWEPYIPFLQSIRHLLECFL